MIIKSVPAEKSGPITRQHIGNQQRGINVPVNMPGDINDVTKSHKFDIKKRNKIREHTKDPKSEDQNLLE